MAKQAVLGIAQLIQDTQVRALADKLAWETINFYNVLKASQEFFACLAAPHRGCFRGRPLEFLADLGVI